MVFATDSGFVYLKGGQNELPSSEGRGRPVRYQSCTPLPPETQYVAQW